MYNLIIFIIEVDISTKHKMGLFSKCFAHYCFEIQNPHGDMQWIFLKLQTLNHIFPLNKNKKEDVVHKKKKSTFSVVCHPLI